jgi:hypothetical protein
MTERLRGQIPEQHTYIPASELPESGYWFGWNYKGPYAGKVKVNLQAIEGIMRAANLPPIRIVADRYRPPEKAEADVMGMTEGGEAFMGQSQTPRFRWNQSEVRHGYFQLAIKVKAEEQVVKEAGELKSKILTSLERQAYLSSLVKGEVEIPYKEVKWNPVEKKFQTVAFVELASHSARIAAIAELNKMDGSHSPTKSEVTMTEAPQIITPGDEPTGH